MRLSATLDLIRIQSEFSGSMKEIISSTEEQLEASKLEVRSTLLKVFLCFLSSDNRHLLRAIFDKKVDTPARALSTVLFFTSFSDSRGEKLSVAALLLRTRSSLLLRSIYRTWPNLTVRLPRNVKQSDAVLNSISRTLSSSSSTLQLTASTTNNELNNVNNVSPF